MIGDAAPSQHLQKLQQHNDVLLDDGQMKTILESHLIPAETLRSYYFATFYQARY